MELFSGKKLSRKDIKESLNIVDSTVSYLISEMIREGLVEISLVREKHRGRPYEIIQLKKDAWYSIGLKIGREMVRGVLFNACMEIIKEIEVHITKEMRNNEGYISAIFRVLKNLSGRNVKAIGISSSGEVDSERIIRSSILNVWNLDLKRRIEKEIGSIVITLMNDVDSLAYFEKYFYGGRRFLVISYGVGIGASFFNENSVFILENGRSILELGHVIVGNGEECYCGQRGCLEIYASEYAVLKEFLKKDFSIKEFIEFEEEMFRRDLEYLRKLAKDPKVVKKYYTPSLKYLSMAVGNLIMLFFPEKVVFYGEGIRSWMVEEIKKFVKERYRNSVVGGISFLCREEEKNAWETGVALNAVEKYISTL
ncbi:MAG: ROK family transcriptional regulator [Thermotogaceae bacterium]|nr:ROK family transcriptional regulator [Thermotogaceae bacterium]